MQIARFLCIVCTLLLAAPVDARGLDGPASPTQEKKTVSPVVTKVASVDSAGTDITNPPRVELGQSLRITVDHLQEWAAQTEQPGGDAGVARDPFKLVLYLDGYPLKGVAVSAMSGDTITFPLRRTSDNRETWTALFTRPEQSRTVEVRVGPPGKPPFGAATPPPSVSLVLYERSALWWAIAGFVVLFGVFGVLAAQSGLLRDGDSQQPVLERPYSLGRCQMALWFFTILGSYIFLRLATKDWDVLPNQALALFGISLATGVSAAVIDASKRNAARSELAELQKKPEAAPTDTARIAALQANLTGGTHVNWLIDILSDADGVSFHRFQMASWTLVLWVMFFASVWRTLAMPEFSDQLLGLMGLSGGTYLGFKFPERKA